MSLRSVSLAMIAASLLGCVNARTLLRQGRLYEACERRIGGSPEDEAAVLAEVQRVAPVRVWLHVVTSAADASGQALALPEARYGRFAASTLWVGPTTTGAPRIRVTLSAPSIEAAPGAGPASARFFDQVDHNLAYAMITGRTGPAPNGSLGGLMLDGLALTLSAGMIDPNQRGRWSVGGAQSDPSQRVAVTDALQRFARREDPVWDCEADAGASCTELLALVPAEGSAAPTRVSYAVFWQVFSGTTSCSLRRDVELALPAGADMASRINAAFASGPLPVEPMAPRVL